MKTIALRFGETFSPSCGTILAHQKVINELGYVWYGKMGNTISDKVIKDIMSNENPKILLIQSGKTQRYWAYISEISKINPPLEHIPQYYRDNSSKFKCWFKITKFESAPKNILRKCLVVSSSQPLGEVSKHSASPYFIIETLEE